MVYLDPNRMKTRRFILERIPFMRQGWKINDEYDFQNAIEDLGGAIERNKPGSSTQKDLFRGYQVEVPRESALEAIEWFDLYSDQIMQWQEIFPPFQTPGPLGWKIIHASKERRTTKEILSCMT